MTDLPTTAGLRLTELLRDPARPDAPEPTLLPWLARRTRSAGLGRAAMAAASSSRLAAGDGRWPVVADAVAAVIAGQAPDPGTLTMLLGILPPVAGHLDEQQSRLVRWPAVRPESLLYAALGGHRAAVGAEMLRRELGTMAQRPVWRVALGAGPAAGSFPALADLQSLDWLISYGASDVSPDSPEQAAYLLPFRFAGASAVGQGTQRRQAIEAITRALGENRYWYAGALLARAVPFLGAEGRARLRPVIADLPAPWSEHLTGLVGSWGPRWQSDEAELAASHPAVARLTELAEAVDPAELADICQAEILDMALRHGLTDGWEAAAGWLHRSPADRAFRAYRTVPEPAYRDLQHLLGILDEPPKAAEPEPARFVNIYVAEAGQDQPVPDAPLIPDRAYDVWCNIGPVDTRSLVDRESAGFPESRLPEGRLKLHVVLFVEGQKAADAPIDLPADGPTAWVQLRLPPAAAAPAVLHAELAIYYGIAVVVVYELTIPVGGSPGHGPEAMLRYRLSRSLTDLEKMAGRSMSIIVPGAVPAVYVNGLDYAPQEFSHSATMVEDAAVAARDELYYAHFTVTGTGRKAGEVSRYTEGRERGYEKSPGDLEEDMRNLARCGADVFEQLFPDENIAARIRAEAVAYGRPPILQVVSLGRELLSIPWASIYDLRLSGDPSEYEPCRSIADFGPGGSGGQPPARCPYEAKHKDLNQLCPWGFWGLSAIIEHPPSVESRDLEAHTGPASGPPAILMSYDTKLDAALRASHIDALRAQQGPALAEPQLTSRAAVQGALMTDPMDVLYFYCHIADDRTRPGQHVPAIGLGGDQVTGKDISGWGRASRSARHPFVILNGCHSVEVGPEALYNLVNPFVTWVKACGLIGTEVTIEQGLGGWAMELFLSELRHHPVGIALRSARWQMFRRGNMMGLAYTPYCLAGLTLA